MAWLGKNENYTADRYRIIWGGGVIQRSKIDCGDSGTAP